jgi:hypothetical protein
MGMNITSVTVSVVVISLLRGGKPNQTEPYQSKARKSRAEQSRNTAEESKAEYTIGKH